MYQLAPDEKRRDVALNILDTYFNNGVNIVLALSYMHVHIERIAELMIELELEILSPFFLIAPYQPLFLFSLPPPHTVVGSSSTRDGSGCGWGMQAETGTESL